MLKEYKTWWDNHINTYPDIVGTPKRLFIQKNGSPLHPDTPTGWFRKFLKRNNLPHTRFHNLRHIHGSILLLMGMDMNSVADQMGHADIQMLVKRYSHNIRKKITDTPDFISKALEDNPENEDK
jgi:integrase